MRLRNETSNNIVNSLWVDPVIQAAGKGEVKLSGSVQTPAQKTAAESAAAVPGLANVLQVDPYTLSVTNKEVGQ